MLVKGDPELIRRISYSHVEQDEIFDLPGVVSRKKQLIPYFTSLLKEMGFRRRDPLQGPHGPAFGRA